MFLAFVCVCLFVLVRAETAGFAGLTNKPSANEAPANTASVPIDCLEELKSGNDGRTWALMLEYDEAELEKLGTELGSDLKSDLDLYASHMNYVDGGFGGESGTQVSTKCTGPTKYWTNGNIMGNDPNSEDETVTADILFVKNVKKESFSASFLKFGVSKESINESTRRQKGCLLLMRSNFSIFVEILESITDALMLLTIRISGYPRIDYFRIEL